jgi:dimethylaniline monooxygenase (N-oxide forming)
MKPENNSLQVILPLRLVFQTKVCSVRKCHDFSSSGQWDVVVETDGKQKTYVFDGVMICSGHYTEKYLPLQDFAGI